MKRKKRLLHLLLVLIILYLNPAYCFNSGQDIFKSPPSYEFPVGLIIASFFLDNTIHSIAQKNQNSLNDKLFKIDRYYGDKVITGGSLLGLYGFSYLIENERMKNLAEKAILSAGVTVVSVVSLKELVGRSRPYKKHGSLHFKPFAFKESRRSFPSGHAAVTFAISTVFAQEIDNILWKTFWYGTASAVAAARVYRDQHWFSDVFAGSAIGYFIARKTIDLYENKKANPLFGLALRQNDLHLTVQFKF